MVTYAHYISSFFFNDTATTEIYTLSLHDALPIFRILKLKVASNRKVKKARPEIWPTQSTSLPWLRAGLTGRPLVDMKRSEEHTSELQSLAYLVCRLLLEKKKT